MTPGTVVRAAAPQAAPLPLSNPTVEIVVPVYNEQDCLETLMGRLLAVQSACGETFEFLSTPFAG